MGALGRERAGSETELEAEPGQWEPGVEGGRELAAPAGQEPVQADPEEGRADRKSVKGKPV
jgi:hypothetical protein